MIKLDQKDSDLVVKQVFEEALNCSVKIAFYTRVFFFIMDRLGKVFDPSFVSTEQ